MKHSEVNIDVYAFGLACSPWLDVGHKNLMQSQKKKTLKGVIYGFEGTPTSPKKQPKSSVNCSYDERNVIFEKTGMCAKLLSLLTNHNVIFSFLLIIST